MSAPTLDRLSGQSSTDAQTWDARQAQTPASTIVPADPIVPSSGRAQDGAQGPAATRDPIPKYLALLDPALSLAAEVLDDLEKVRMANANRLRILTTLEADEDGVVRGFGLDESHPDVARLAAMVESLVKLEHDATLNLQRAMRKHLLGPWVKAQVGIGEKQAARLLAAIGDPYWNTAADRPRTVSALWAYCGLHVLPASQERNDTQSVLAGGDQTGDSHPDLRIRDTHGTTVGVAARRRKGQRANWSTTAKTRAYLIALSCIKQARSPYRATYDQRRAHTAVTHPEWTDGHSHNDAIRVTSKAILRDLWIEARRIHEERS